jgi:hypothetical protein
MNADCHRDTLKENSTVTTKEHFALLDRQMAAHTRQIKAIRELVHEGKRLAVAARKDLRALAAMSKRKIDLQ